MNLSLYFILSKTTSRNDQVINRSYDGGIKDSPISLEESHDVLPPRAVIASVETCRGR